MFKGLKLEKITSSHQAEKLISAVTNFNKKNSIYKQSDHVPVIDSSDIQFIFYSRMVPEGKLIENPEDLQDFNSDELTKFIIHGWLSSGYKSTCQSIKDAYLKESKVNIFIINWEKIANSYLYFLILQKMAPLADYYAEFLTKLIKLKNLDPGALHLIGHSLGAHISGMVGKRLQKNGFTIGRITGLDPASPGFHESSDLEKLSKLDASFLDVIHTSGGTLGIQESIGHIDFFPNGGVAPMPGCVKLLVYDQCSHSKSWKYFAESISNAFFAIKCDRMESFQEGNCAKMFIKMGEYTPKDARGNYYLSTNCEEPYSLGLDGLKALCVCDG
ncbi:hypothetical protein WA026_017170 [Henosepilachna vigintioctopunctata]|uniref:Lipase domain-containing protein n=1 Tax=Henosepilachna vigintioctopunctata TaxID=420089 RepID=A0AAW1UDA6_9CUCU